GVARWSAADGAWSSLGDAATSARAVVAPRDGEIFLGGGVIGGPVSASWARWTDNPAPRAALQPRDPAAEPGQTASLSATPARGYTSVSYRWYRNGEPVTDGPGGASPGGGVASGASGLLASPTDGTPAVLSISNVQPS